MQGTTIVELARLRRQINLIFDHMEIDLGLKQLELQQDDYWHVLTPEKYDLSRSPGELGVGKLGDDWEFLCKMSNQRREAVALMLVHVAPLLEQIGEQVGQ